MAVHIALLRAVNVAGSRKVAMADLRAMMEDLGFPARTLLQSGNLVFSGSTLDGGSLEERLKAETAKRLGLTTDFFVRSADEWKTLMAANPFSEEAKRDPGHLLLLLLKEAPAAAAVDRLKQSIRGRETVTAGDRALYAVYPDGIGRSKLTTALIEKAVATRATGRNWNTVTKLGALTADFVQG